MILCIYPDGYNFTEERFFVASISIFETVGILWNSIALINKNVY